MIYHENKNAINLLVSDTGDDLNLMRVNKELLTEPVIFIRKWIGEVKLKLKCLAKIDKSLNLLIFLNIRVFQVFCAKIHFCMFGINFSCLYGHREILK